ncbi:hypothetical protein ABT336_20335 [Micromonospora sp. NPDC000207]|uniref:hypothetical protein n=1 Tax=Micromonospora sp. NPDC000207 TaxID=3154246 RepID=UPI00331E9FC7
MSVRRHVVRVVAASAVLGGLLVVGASPAYADEDSVRVRSTNGFSAGGSPGSVTVEVRKRSEGCVRVRTALGLQLDGLRADQVRMEVDADGGRAPVGVTGTDGSVGSGFVAPKRPVLCEGKKVQVRYRISFEAGAPAGRVAVFAQVSTAQGESFGQDATTSRVGGRLASSPGPAPTVTRSPVTSPSPSAEATREPTEAPVTTAGAGLVPVAAEQPSAAPTSGSLSPILYFGVALVVLGLGLIVLLIRRSRADRRDRRERAAQVDPPGRPDGIGQPGHQRPSVAGPGPGPQPPRVGETVYRSGGGSPAGRPAGGAPAASGGVYGRPAGQPAPPPAPPAGHVYGAPAARPTGNVYGAPPARPTGNVYGAPSAPAVPPSGPDARAAGAAAVPAVPPSGPDPRAVGPTAADPGRPPQATPPPVPQAPPPQAPPPQAPPPQANPPQAPPPQANPPQATPPPVSAAGGGADPSPAGPTTPGTGSPAGDPPASPPTGPGPQAASERTSTQAGGDSTSVMPQPPQ